MLKLLRILVYATENKNAKKYGLNLFRKTFASSTVHREAKFFLPIRN